MKKFIQSLDETIFAKLETVAKSKGLSVQELLRAIIIPEWLEKQDFSLAGKTREISKFFGGPEGEQK